MHIQELDHLRECSPIRFVEHEVNGETVTVVSYIVMDDATWRIPGAVECRGIVFDSQGDCICRPFPKFFNLGENYFTQPEHFNWDQLIVTEKVDGSLLTPVLVNGKMFFKTKKSFTNDIAVRATELALQDSRFWRLCWDCVTSNFTPIFEFTDPINRVVLKYDRPFTLLAIRHQRTGDYLSPREMFVYAANSGVEVAEHFNKTYDQLIQDQRTLTNWEGYVIQDKTTGQFAKIKTDWYVQAHRIRTELSWRAVAEMIADETIDDQKAWIRSNPDLDFDWDQLKKLETRVSQEIAGIDTQSDQIVKECQGWSIKDFAIDYKDHFLFPILILKFKGQEPDIKMFWKRKYLPEYPTTALENPNF